MQSNKHVFNYIQTSEQILTEIQMSPRHNAYRTIYKHNMHTHMDNNKIVTELLHQLNRTINPGNTWNGNTQIRDVMFVSPDRTFAWLFRISPRGQVFPSNDRHEEDHNCKLYIHNVSQFHTVSECLQDFHIIPDSYSDFQVINIIGELIIDPTQAPVQTVCLISK